jgi:predicted alpha/beta-hydrolase family hydrolase
VSVHWIADGDHSLVPRKRSGYTETENLEHAVCAITGFVDPVVANFPS